MELLRSRITGHKTIEQWQKARFRFDPLYYPRISRCPLKFEDRSTSLSNRSSLSLSLSLLSSSQNLSASRRYFETRSTFDGGNLSPPGRFLNIHEQSCGNPLRCDVIRCISGTRVVAKGSSRIDALPPRNWPWDVIERAFVQRPRGE